METVWDKLRTMLAELCNIHTRIRSISDFEEASRAIVAFLNKILVETNKNVEESRRRKSGTAQQENALVSAKSRYY